MKRKSKISLLVPRSSVADTLLASSHFHHFVSCTLSFSLYRSCLVPSPRPAVSLSLSVPVARLTPSTDSSNRRLLLSLRSSGDSFDLVHATHATTEHSRPPVLTLSRNWIFLHWLDKNRRTRRASTTDALARHRDTGKLRKRTHRIRPTNDSLASACSRRRHLLEHVAHYWRHWTAPMFEMAKFVCRHGSCMWLTCKCLCVSVTFESVQVCGNMYVRMYVRYLIFIYTHYTMINYRKSSNLRVHISFVVIDKTSICILKMLPILTIS